MSSSLPSGWAAPPAKGQAMYNTQLGPWPVEFTTGTGALDPPEGGPLLLDPAVPISPTNDVTIAVTDCLELSGPAKSAVSVADATQASRADGGKREEVSSGCIAAEATSPQKRTLRPRRIVESRTCVLSEAWWL